MNDPNVAICFQCKLNQSVQVRTPANQVFCSEKCYLEWCDEEKLIDKRDSINPPHYTRLGPQPYEVIKAWDLNYFLGSAIKYIARAGHKEGATEEEDLKKAIRHIELYLVKK